MQDILSVYLAEAKHQLVVNVYVFTPHAFVQACRIGNLPKAQWMLHRLDASNSIRTQPWKASDILAKEWYVAFYHACAIGNIAVAKWLVEIKQNVNMATLEKSLRRACIAGQVAVTRWLFSMLIAHYLGVKCDKCGANENIRICRQ